MTDEQRAARVAPWTGTWWCAGALGAEHLDPGARLHQRAGWTRTPANGTRDGDLATLHEHEPFGRRYAAIHEELSGREQEPQGRKPLFAVADLCNRGAVRPLHPPRHQGRVAGDHRAGGDPARHLGDSGQAAGRLPRPRSRGTRTATTTMSTRPARFEATTEHMRVITTWMPLGGRRHRQRLPVGHSRAVTGGGFPVRRPARPQPATC